MPADDLLQPPSEPELDQYGVQAQPPPKGRPFLVASSYLACALIQVLAFAAYIKDEHHNLPAGLRMLTLGAALIGVLAFALFQKKHEKLGNGLKGWPEVIFGVSILTIVLGTLCLLFVGLIPHGLACHHNCGGGGGGY